MHHSSEKPKTKNSIFTVLIALVFFYGMGHLTPAFIPASTSSLFSLNGPSAAYAEDEEEDEEEEDEEEFKVDSDHPHGPESRQEVLDQLDEKVLRSVIRQALQKSLQAE